MLRACVNNAALLLHGCFLCGCLLRTLLFGILLRYACVYSPKKTCPCHRSCSGVAAF